MGTFTKIIGWLALGAATAPIWAALLWVLWQGIIRPRLVPRAEVERLAAGLIARYGDRAEEVAFAEEYGAWRNSDGFDQGKWRRVRSIVQHKKINFGHFAAKNLELTTRSRKCSCIKK